jgi:hypothetical protein
MLDELAIAQKRIADLEAFIDKSITTKRLRDEFAMAAIPVVMNEMWDEYNIAARHCYKIADAFMAEREKTK